MGKPHLSMGQHNGFKNMAWYKIIFRLKKKITTTSSKIVLYWNYSGELIYKNKGKSKEENLDIISNCLASLNHAITQGTKRWKMEWFFCLYVIWNGNYFFPRIDFKLLWREEQYKRWEPPMKFPHSPQGNVQVTSKPLLREVFSCYMVNPFGTPCSKWRDKRNLLYSLLLQLPRRQQWIRGPERQLGNFHACGVSESWDKVDFERCGSCFSNVLL